MCVCVCVCVCCQFIEGRRGCVLCKNDLDSLATEMCYCSDSFLHLMDLSLVIDRQVGDMPHGWKYTMQIRVTNAELPVLYSITPCIVVTLCCYHALLLL